MSCVLDPPVVCRGSVLAAVSRVGVSRFGAGRAAVFHCTKRPEAILARRGETVLVLAPSGKPMTPQELDRLSPGILARFLSLTGDLI